MSDPINDLSAFCSKFGGQLSILDSNGLFPPTVEYAPFDYKALATDWHAKHIYATKDAHWAGIIHDMGHVFACTVPPSQAKDEYDFFGWEYALVKHLKLPLDSWKEANKEYIVGETTIPFGPFEQAAQSSIIRLRVREAIKLGLVSRKGRSLIPNVLR